MSFRKEKKYKLTASDQKILKNNLINKGMKLLYPKREINSIYLDTKSLDFYLNSEEGVLPRKKIRIRWYNTDLKKVSKETKVSNTNKGSEVIESANKAKLDEEEGVGIKSPIIGTVYLSPEPGAKKFVQIGQNIKKGQTIMIVEAMKTMNHIPATSDGVVKNILVKDGQPVEFGQNLIFLK